MAVGKPITELGFLIVLEMIWQGNNKDQEVGLIASSQVDTIIIITSRDQGRAKRT